MEFLRARLNEDQTEISKHPDDAFEVDGFSTRHETNYPCNEILTIGKKRALREVEAKRRMLDELYPEVKAADESIEGEWNSNPYNADALLELLALPYADHPDYCEEGRP